MSTLTQILDHIGFAPRPQQLALYEALKTIDDPGATGVVAQAGTGTGKSIAVLAAAYDASVAHRKPTLVITPTNILMSQYTTTDAPRVSEALGITIKSLKGRNRYLCSNAPGFSGVGRLPDEVIALEVEMNQRLHEDEIFEPENTYWFGCPGSDECDPRNEDTICHYRRAKNELDDADIIVTNAHLLIINDQLRGKPPIELKDKETGEPIGEYQPSIFPEHGAVFVDEAHTLEDNLRSFATRSIPLGAVDGLGLGSWLVDQQRHHRSAVAVTPTRELAAALKEVADTIKEPDLNKPQKEAAAAAAYIIQRGVDKAYAENEAVLWFDPQEYPKKPRLVSTQINLAGGARRILTAQPFGLVSGTVPKSLRGALGIADAYFVDTGHPFDYSKQVTLRISSKSGSFKATKNKPEWTTQRITEVGQAIIDAGGGALCLFPSYRDMEMVHRELDADLAAKGLDLRVQTREGDKGELGQWFKDHGNAVLFGTESFATGFDVPGDALRLVVIWKVPYPGLDPVTKAIAARSRQRYEDMALMKITQAAGRLVRTSTDTGTIFIVDSRAEDVLFGRDDPMIAHFEEMAMTKKKTRAWDIE